MDVKKFLFAVFSTLLVGPSKSSCGYESCHPLKDDLINVHVIAHTHDDVGWVKTVDQYYNDNFGGVRKIITSSVEALRKNKNRRFMYVESAFLFKWWQEQKPLMKNRFKKLVDDGQLEIVSGGWTMNDEATTHYQSIIDQFTLGLSKINETFGACGRPKIGWQIDPFGHSKEMASIFSQLGFDGLFLGRIDYQDKEHRFRTRTAETMWQGSKSLGHNSQIFTTVLFNTYWPPEQFCVDDLCGWSAFSNGIHQYEWDSLVKFMENQAKIYKTNNIILTMGGDFHYTRAETSFKRLDQIIKSGNAKQRDGSKFHFIYSTPSCYLKAVYDKANENKIHFPTTADDFFPYASSENRYWTGFYTSRPTLKRFERVGNNFLQACKQLSALANLDQPQLQQIESLKEAMGILQHHDAVSGTEQQHVANDYSKILSVGLENCGETSSGALNKLFVNNPLDTFNVPDFPFVSCLLSNISQCDFSELSNNFIVTIYNPLSRPVDHYVRLPVTESVYSVMGPNGTMNPVQMVPIPKQVLKIPGRQSIATVELVFIAHQIPPLGFKSYYIRKNPKNNTHHSTLHKAPTNKKVDIKLKENGFLQEIRIANRSIPVFQEYLFYQGMSNYIDSSGAYVFRPTSQGAARIYHSAKVEVHDGPILREVHQRFNEWTSQAIKLYHKESYVELQWLVGPLPEDGIAREVISRFTTNLNSRATFFTDSNGREMVGRVRDLRPTFRLKLTEPISSNYYPITSKIMIVDPNQNLRVAVLTDRSQGGSSLQDGQIELMVHRNSLKDDGLGVQEPLNEKAFGKPLVVRGSHYLIAGLGDDTLVIEKDLAQRKLLEAWTFLSPTNQLSYHDYNTLYQMEYSGLNSALPRNVQILTLEPRSANKLLLRLEHIFEKYEHLVWSQPATIDIKNLFKAFRVVDLRETTLGGNQWLNESEPMKFAIGKVPSFEIPGQRAKVVKRVRSCAKQGGKFEICLEPMQIRTFLVEVKRSVEL